MIVAGDWYSQSSIEDEPPAGEALEKLLAEALPHVLKMSIIELINFKFEPPGIMVIR